MAAGYVPAFTKCLVPELPLSHVQRPDLVARLDASVRQHPITVVVGFPGAGKSVLAAEWCRTTSAGTVAWLSCDLIDVTPAHFWTALVYALRAFDPRLGEDALDLIEPNEEIDAEFLTALVNDMAALAGPCVLVVDDLQLAGARPLELFGRLLDRVPPALRFVLCTRADPRLPIHRWRATGRLGELRTADLRLTPGDVQRVVHAIGVDVSTDDALTLSERTEGWAAGVQLAALSMRAEPDPRTFLRAFAGSDRNVTDFLVGEVLAHQPEEVVDFLLATSVLDQFDAAVCNALAGRNDAAVVLDQLETANLLLIPLDNERSLFRYHHLFQDLLRRLLRARQPDRYVALHSVASEWYEAHDDITRALRHAVEGGDAERVFELMRLGLIAGFFSGRGDMVRGWLADLDLETLDTAPDLMLEYAIALELVGEWGELEVWLNRLDRSLPTAPSARFLARHHVAHGFRAAQRGELADSIALLDAARLANVEARDDAVASIDLARVRVATWLDDFDGARLVYEHLAGPESELGPVPRLILDGSMAEAEWEAGVLRPAVARAEATLTAMTRAGSEMHVGVHDTIRTLACFAYEQDRLDDAEVLSERSLQLVSGVRSPFELASLIDLARIWHARNDDEAAFSALARATATMPAGSRSPLVQRVEVWESRWLAERGEVSGARALATGLDAGRRREVALIRCHLAAGDWDHARAALDIVVKDQPTPRAVLVDALLDARIKIGAGVPADGALHTILGLAREHGYVRTLIDEGPQFVEALSSALRREPRDEYTAAVARAITTASARTPVARVALPGNVTLSDREATVLRLLATSLTTREIASELFVSQNTLKTHLKSIYRKLGADSRRAAVEAARSYGVL